MTEQPAFPMVATPAARTMAKPRQSGQTMMIDWGLPLGHLDDLLDMSGDFVDLAKIAVGSVRVYGEAKLRRKLEIYKDHAVRCFIGGGIIERLYALDGRDALGPFFREATRVGIDVVEISDNYVTLDREERFRQIGLARDAGLAVFGEIGSKHGHTDVDFLLGQADDCFAAGAEMVIVEGYELVDNGQPKIAFISALRSKLDLSKALFELPGPWISGINASQVQDLKKFLIGEFGPDVSIGNVMPDEVFEMEMSRQGMSVVQPTSLSQRGR